MDVEDIDGNNIIGCSDFLNRSLWLCVINLGI